MSTEPSSLFLELKVDWNNVLLTVERAVRDRLEMPVVKVDVHAPIFYFPKPLPKHKW